MWKVLSLLAAVASVHGAQITYSCNSIDPSTCSGTITNVASADEAITVAGQLSTFADPAVRWLTFNNSQIDFFPKRIYNVFPNLSSVKFNYPNLPTLTENAFGTCGSLQDINIFGSNAQTLPARVAQNCTGLTVFSVFYGELRTLDRDSLVGLTSVMMVMLNNNKITCVPPGFFAPLPSLVEVMLSGNQIAALDPNVFQGQAHIGVHFGYNKLTYLPAFNTTATDLILHFTGNNITALSPNMLSNTFQSQDVLLFFSYSGDGSNAITCFTASNAELNPTNYQQLQNTYGACYANWTPAMENARFPCTAVTTTSATTTTTASTTTTTTTASTTTANFSRCSSLNMVRCILCCNLDVPVNLRLACLKSCRKFF